MTKQERQGWIIVASLFVTLLIVFGGGYNVFTVFLPPLVQQFGWSRAQVASLQSVLAFSAGLAAPLIGWMLDRIEARVLIAGGALLAGLAYLGASIADSYFVLMCCYAVLGLGISAATLLPCSLVIANWFTSGRGLAMGITFAGTSLGGALMALVASYAIASGGWRAGYLVLALPMLIIVTPLAFLFVRSRPASEVTVTVSQRADALPGLELNEALRTRSFWMISLAQFAFAFSASGIMAHLVAYLVGGGYTPTTAAIVVSTGFVLTSGGKLVMGFFADRLSGRVALAANFIGAGIGTILLLGVDSTAILAMFVLVFGLMMGAPLVLVPMVMVDSLGLKRFGTLAGVSGMFNTAGGVAGPLVAGLIFDATASYTIAFQIFVVTLVAGAVASYSCQPLAVEQSQLERVAASA